MTNLAGTLIGSGLVLLVLVAVGYGLPAALTWFRKPGLPQDVPEPRTGTEDVRQAHRVIFAFLASQGLDEAAGLAITLEESRALAAKADMAWPGGDK